MLVVLNLRENRMKGISLIICSLEVTLCLAFEVVSILAVSLSALLTNWVLKYKVNWLKLMSRYREKIGV